jgi:AraC family transcriptional regulator
MKTGEKSLMHGVLKIQGEVSSELLRQRFDEQVVVKMLSPAKFDFGETPEKMSLYAYSVGELILCRRHTEEWARWQSTIRMLAFVIPDQAFGAVVDDMNGGKLELEASSRLEDPTVSALLSAVEAEEAAGHPSGRLFFDSIGHALAATLLRSRGHLRHPLRDYRGNLPAFKMRRVLDFVHAHMSDDVSMAALAREADLSPAYFSQAFRRSTGMSPHQYVLRLRVDRAKQLLHKSDLRVIDIAIECGFRTQQHFARVFRSVARVTPTEYRRIVLT